MTKFPTKGLRAKCWESRDEYFECLDKNGIWLDGLSPQTHEEIINIDPLNLKIQSKTYSNSSLFTCSKLKHLFQSQCLDSWSHHFAINRVRELQREKQIDKIEKDEIERKRNMNEFWESVKTKST
jgi:cytochrome c oxidase assembly factor 6